MSHWATHAIEKLQNGEQAIVCPKGNSMKGKVKSGAKVTLAPVEPDTLQTEDVVLVKVKGRVYLHLIHAISDKGFLIGNNVGGLNGWVNKSAIYGKAIQIEQ